MPETDLGAIASRDLAQVPEGTVGKGDVVV